MKKLLLIILILSSIVIADDKGIEKRIFESIFKELSTQDHPKVYTNDKVESLALSSELFERVDSCEEAEIIIMTTKEIAGECQGKIVFGTRYRHLKQPYVTGAFFWQKGRPNIVFKEELLHKHEITLSASMNDYVE